MWAKLAALFLLGYPAIAHVAVLTGNKHAAGVYLIFVVCILLVQSICRKAAWASLVLSMILVYGAWALLHEHAVFLMYIPPIAISLGLLLLFGFSLRKDEVPLVTRMALILDDEVDETVALYTRRVTVAWTLFFALLLIESIALSILAPLHLWSLFTNFINYVLMGLVFLVEFQIRKRKLAGHRQSSFMGFMRNLLSIKRAQLKN